MRDADQAWLSDGLSALVCRRQVEAQAARFGADQEHEGAAVLAVEVVDLGLTLRLHTPRCALCCVHDSNCWNCLARVQMPCKEQYAPHAP